MIYNGYKNAVIVETELSQISYLFRNSPVVHFQAVLKFLLEVRHNLNVSRTGKCTNGP